MRFLAKLFFASVLCSFIFAYRAGAATLAEWTILIYIQADNNLAPFATYNINDMQSGIAADSPLVNLLVQWDQPNNKRTWRYRIVKNGKIEDGSLSAEMGINPAVELAASAPWIKRKYPAKKYAYVLWNHGSGIEDKKVNSNNRIDPRGSWMEIPGMAKGVISQAKSKSEAERGILYDYSQNTYLSNQGLTQAFTQIKTTLGRGVDMIGMDACMMSMFEVAYQLRGLTSVMVGSEQTEPGYGWAYSGFIKSLTMNPTSFDAKKLGKAIVDSYGVFYNSADEWDYTQSAFDMSYLDSLKTNIDSMVLGVAEAKKYNALQMKNAVIAARLNAVTFYVSSYVDLFSFYQKFYQQISKIRQSFKTVSTYTRSLDSLKTILTQGMSLVNSSILANTVGYYDANAKGIAIYYPNPNKSSSIIHSSYPLTLFAQKSQWLKFIKENRK